MSMTRIGSWRNAEGPGARLWIAISWTAEHQPPVPPVLIPCYDADKKWRVDVSTIHDITLCMALLLTPTHGSQGAANAPNLGQLSGAPLAQALGAKPGSSEGRSGASKWLRADYGATPIQPEISNVINVG